MNPEKFFPENQNLKKLKYSHIRSRGFKAINYTPSSIIEVLRTYACVGMYTERDNVHYYCFFRRSTVLVNEIQKKVAMTSVAYLARPCIVSL